MPVYQPEVECASRDYLHAIQSARLIRMVRNAYEHVPFYRQKFDDIGLAPGYIHSIDDVTKLPFTVKTDLRDNYPFGLFAVPQSELVRIHASSGTTGKQTVVGYTRHDIDVWAEGAARALNAAGATREDIIHVSYGYGLFTGGLGLHYGAEHMGATALPVSSGNTKRQVQILQDFGSNFLCCTPSYAMFIGETVRDMGIDPKTLKLRGGLFGAEPWTDHMRHEIERLLAIKAYDIYGLTELSGPGVAFECSAQSGMHINEDHFIAEIIDPDTGEVLPEGSKGELVFTSIDKEAFPLLRYRTRDICILKREKCSCGRTLVKMCKPMGRSDDMLIIRGVNVFPSQIETVLLNHGYPANYQIIVGRVKSTDTLDVHVEMTPEMFTDNVGEIERRQKQLVDGLRAMLGLAAKVTLVAPKSIVRSEGKAVRVIDNRKI